MPNPIPDIFGRLAEYKDAIRKLIREKPEFDALCTEYASLSISLDDLARAKGPDVTARADALRKRIAAIEEQLITVIEGYTPV
jgi:hypothetical protein